MDCDLLHVMAENGLLGKCCVWLHMQPVIPLSMPRSSNGMIMGTGLKNFYVIGRNSYHTYS